MKKDAIKIPSFISQYLWDVDDSKLSNQNSDFIIERVLEYGDTEAFEWLKKNFKKNQIVKVLKESKKISPKTGNFYALYYDLKKEELLCIRKPFTQKQNRF